MEKGTRIGADCPGGLKKNEMKFREDYISYL